MSEKTEQPTSKKLRDARKQGQLPRSRLLTSGAVTAGGLAGLLATASVGAAQLQAWTAELFLLQDVTVEAAAVRGLLVLGWLVGPAMVGAFLAAFAVSAATAGLEFHPESVQPKLERVSLAAGFKRLFSPRQLVDTAKNLLLAAVVASILWQAVSDAGPDALRAVYLDGSGGLLAVLALFRPVVVKLCVLVLVLGAFDYLLAKRRHLKDLMMTREEVKQEHKNSEGDPHAKSKRKAAHRSLANQGPARGVQKATAVVVNPTHIAVALRYEPSECDAPYIVAKGQEQDAFALRREAKRQGIPVVKDIPLARSLIHYDVGEEIPEELYRAAAAVLKAAMDEREMDASPRSRTHE